MLKALIIEDDKFLAASLKAAISEKFDIAFCLQNKVYGDIFNYVNLWYTLVKIKILWSKNGKIYN